jgi:hypothetical protein
MIMSLGVLEHHQCHDHDAEDPLRTVQKSAMRRGQLNPSPTSAARAR